MSDWTKQTETLGWTSNTVAPYQATGDFSNILWPPVAWGAMVIQFLT